jgi:Holliday junction resolvase
VRRAAKRDANEREIIDALEQSGCEVWPISQEGMPDLYVQLGDGGYWLEVKNPEGGRLTKAQYDNLTRGLRFSIVTNVTEALHAVGLRRG